MTASEKRFANNMHEHIEVFIVYTVTALLIGRIFFA